MNGLRNLMEFSSYKVLLEIRPVDKELGNVEFDIKEMNILRYADDVPLNLNQANLYKCATV